MEVNHQQDRKRIAYVINRIGNGGPGNVVLNLINNIDISQFVPILITIFEGNDSDIVNRLKEKGITVVECHNNSRIKYILFGQKEFKKIIYENKIDVIHSHGFVPDMASARIRSCVRKINTIHNVMFEDYLFYYGKWKSAIYTKLHLRAMKKLDICVCCSKSVYDVMKNYLKKAIFIRNGVAENNTSDIETREHLGIPKTAIVFIYVGRLSRRKRTVQLVASFHCSHSENEYLLLIGEGAERSKCQEINDDHIIYMGFQNNPYRYMRIADIYISASATEGLSMSIIEALSCGLGLFISDIPSHREFFMISKDIYLGETFSENAFSDALKKLRDNLSKLDRAKIKEFQKKYLSDENMARQYELLY